MAISTEHPRFTLLAAVVQNLRESNTSAGNNVFPQRLEFFDLDSIQPPFIGVYLGKEMHQMGDMPPDYRRELPIIVDCWQAVGREVDPLDYIANFSRFGAEVESAMHTGRNRIRAIAETVNFWRTINLVSHELSLISEEGTVLYTAQTYEYTLIYEWVPGLVVDGLNSFQNITNTWNLPPSVNVPRVFSRELLTGG